MGLFVATRREIVVMSASGSRRLPAARRVHSLLGSMATATAAFEACSTNLREFGRCCSLIAVVDYCFEL